MKSYRKKISEWCEFFDVAYAAIIGPSRKANIKNARFCMMRYLYEIGGLSLENIGYLFGGRDHSTVIHAKTTYIDLCSTNEDKQKEWNDFKLFVIKYNGKKNFVLKDSHNKSIKIHDKNLKYKFEELLRSNKGKVINESLIEKFEIQAL